MRLIFVTGYFLFCSTQVAGDTSQQVSCAVLSIQKASKLLQPDRVVKSEFFALTEIRHICLGDVQYAREGSGLCKTEKLKSLQREGKPILA